MRVVGRMSFRRAKVGARALGLLVVLGLASTAPGAELAGDTAAENGHGLLAAVSALGGSASESIDQAPCQLVPALPENPSQSFPAIDADDTKAADSDAVGDIRPDEVDEYELPADCDISNDCDDPHQVWLISSREIGACDDTVTSVGRIRYWHYQRGHGWIAASAEEFQASDEPAMPTVFYVHGHRIDQSYAKEGGWDAYRAIVQPTAIPTRYVIYSWPTTPHGNPMREFRIRACESEVHGYYLAWVIDRVQPEIPIHLVGFSYGARLITSTLHYLGGGAIGRYSLNDRVFPQRLPMRASLIAAALDNDWLLPGRRHGQALTRVDRLFVTKNPVDPVLHWYPVVLRDRTAVALGVTGFAGLNRLGSDRSKVEQLNVSQAVGRRHAIALYWDIDRVVGTIRGMVDEVAAKESTN